MTTDNIIEIGIDEYNRLYIKPEKERFDLIYRTATEVHWDSKGKFLYSPTELKGWTYFDWFRHIIGVVKDECGCVLIFTKKTNWISIPEELKNRILVQMEIEELTSEVLGEMLMTPFDSNIFVDWAVNLMERGYESDSLIILAGLDNDSTEVREKYFWSAIKELKIIVDKENLKLIENYALLLAKKVVANRLAPRIGLSKMTGVVRAMEYGIKYIQFYELDEDIDYLLYEQVPLYNSNINKDNIDELIKREFELFLTINKEGIDSSYFDKSYCNDCKGITTPIIKTVYQFKRPFKYHIWVCKKCHSKNMDSFHSQIGKEKIIEILRKEN